MKFKILLFSLLLIFITGCTKKLSLEDELVCSKLGSFSKATQRTDFQNNFKISIPNNWKYKLYYDDYQSAVFMADTIKQLTETFIIDVSWKYGALNLDASFETLIQSKTSFQIIKSNFEEYKEFSSYWNVSKGIKNDFPYHVFNMFIQTSEEAYLEIKTEFYGEELVDERLCNAFEIINTLEFLN